MPIDDWNGGGSALRIESYHRPVAIGMGLA